MSVLVWFVGCGSCGCLSSPFSGVPAYNETMSILLTGIIRLCVHGRKVSYPYYILIEAW